MDFPFPISHFQSICKTSIFKGGIAWFFLSVVLLFVWAYSLPTLTTKPAYWYDEAMNVELARNFAEFGRLDLVVAPNTFSGKGVTVGSTGYPVTVPLAGFFKVFGFGLAQARVYMLLWMSAFFIAFFFIARKLWGPLVAYGGTALIASFAPFYGNGRSVMGEIPGFLFFLLSFYFLEKRKWVPSGALLGLAVVSKPSVFVFLIPAYAVAMFFMDGAWKERLSGFLKLGAGSLLALVPWAAMYADELAQGGIVGSIYTHFKNPYAEVGVSSFANITNNLPTFATSTTLLYIWLMLAAVIAACVIRRSFLREHRVLFIIAAIYIPLALLQYLKSFGYLRYLIAAELLFFLLFLLALPVLAQRFVSPEHSSARFFAGMLATVMVIVHLVQLFWFSELFSSDKTQRTMAYLSAAYPTATVGVINIPHVASLLPADRKYQHLSTFGVWDFGIHPLRLPADALPAVIVAEFEEKALSQEEQAVLLRHYRQDTAFADAFTVYVKESF